MRPRVQLEGALAARVDRIATLPAEYQIEILDAIDRLTITYASLTGVMLPQMRSLAVPGTDGKVIQFPAPVRS